MKKLKKITIIALTLCMLFASAVPTLAITKKQQKCTHGVTATTLNIADVAKIKFPKKYPFYTIFYTKTETSYTHKCKYCSLPYKVRIIVQYTTKEKTSSKYLPSRVKYYISYKGYCGSSWLYCGSTTKLPAKITS